MSPPDTRHPAGSAVPLAPTIESLGTAPRRTFPQVVDLGFSFVQLSAMQPGLRPRELDRSGRRDLAATIRRHGLAVAGLDLWIPTEHYLDPVRSDRAIAATIEAIGLAEDLGRCSVSVALPRANTDEQVASVAAALAPLVERAERHGIALADHALPVEDRRGVAVGIDPATWLAAGQDPATGATQAGDRLASARLCDRLLSGARAPIGRPDGRLDVLAYRLALGMGGADGPDVTPDVTPVVIDAREWDDPWGGLVATRDCWAHSARPSD